MRMKSIEIDKIPWLSISQQAQQQQPIHWPRLIERVYQLSAVCIYYIRLESNSSSPSTQSHNEREWQSPHNTAHVQWQCSNRHGHQSHTPPPSAVQCVVHGPLLRLVWGSAGSSHRRHSTGHAAHDRLIVECRRWWVSGRRSHHSQCLQCLPTTQRILIRCQHPKGHPQFKRSRRKFYHIHRWCLGSSPIRSLSQ